jgi:WD40 repeat protein
MSGGVDGSILLWQFNVSQPLSTYRSSGRCKVTKIRFSWNGSKFAAGDAGGNLLLWRFDSQIESATPYLVCCSFSHRVYHIPFSSFSLALSLSLSHINTPTKLTLAPALSFFNNNKRSKRED